VWERRLTVLRTLGVNAIRTAHNPPAPAFLDLCDRMGFLVMDEAFDCWSVGKTTLGSPGQPLHDYHLFFNEWSKTDLRDMVRRDRNHPSIIIYSAGNEIHDTPNGELAKGILAGLVKVFHENDPTRPVTLALLRPNRVDGTSDYTNGLADLLDVVGTNYRDSELLAAWKTKPTWKILGTEQRQDSQTWVHARDNPEHAGQFIWAGIDYLGEARAWPLVASGSGLIDRTAIPRGRAYERQSWWSDQPVVRLARRITPTTGTSVPVNDVTISRVFTNTLDWTPADTSPHDEKVLVFSNCEEVELFLNDRSLGSKPLPANAEPREWTVAYAPGKLRAVGTNHGVVVATDEMRTAGPATRLVLAADAGSLAQGWDHVARVTVTVVDADGTCVPGAFHLVKFTLTGPGIIAAVDNGDNAGHESFQGTQRHAYQGRCVAYLRATATAGAITLTALADGLTSGSVTLNASSGKP
jgi:beta-galactosidase